MESAEIITFWFSTLKPEDWYVKNPELDALITRQFSSIHQSAVQAELWSWRSTSEGALAEIIILDQFSRNMFRDDPRSFAFDGMSLILAQEAVAKGFHDQLAPTQRAFMLMPYMHSESSLVHEEAVKLFSAHGLEYNLEFEMKHKAIIDRFGRYPHRNAVLGRASTGEEAAFLLEDGSSF